MSVSPRFTDNGDGTVKDNLTGLIWLQDAACIRQRTWTSALANANALSDGACGLTDGSVGGDWGLPNVRELESLIDFQNVLPALPAGHPFSGVQLFYYWSSTTVVNYPSNAWYVYPGLGSVNNTGKTSTYNAWPVRGGPEALWFLGSFGGCSEFVSWGSRDCRQAGASIPSAQQIRWGTR